MLSEWPKASVLAFCLLTALVLRFASLGDPDLHIDETFYFYVGQQMHHGAAPYVDIWDRKPLGLFILFWLFAGISTSVWSYQIAALLSAAVTAFLITRFVARWSGPLAQMMAALAYLALLHPLNGHGGQSPVFYNPLIAGAALASLISRDTLLGGRVPRAAILAMGLCGIALTLKQTTVFESLFFGIWMLALLRQSGAGAARIARAALLFGLVGALPTLSIALWYWQAGHFAQFWYAMVTANSARPPIAQAASINLPIIAQIVAMLALAAIAALMLARRFPAFLPYRNFLAGWTLAALLGFVSVGSYYDHHAIPLIVPLCVAASVLFSRGLYGPVLGATISLVAMAQANPFAFALHRNSTRDFDRLQHQIATDPGNGVLLIYDGPMLLYATHGVHAAGPNQFPTHINAISERGTSYYPQVGELERILALRPGNVVMMDDPGIPMAPGDPELLRAYVTHHCQRAIVAQRWRMRESRVPVRLYSGCR